MLLTSVGARGPRSILFWTALSIALAAMLASAGTHGRAAYTFGVEQPSSQGFAASAATIACDAGMIVAQEGGAAPPAAGPTDTDLAALRCISDPFPTFNGVAVDPQHGLVALSDTNRKSLLIYDRTAGGNSSEETPPARRIMGPKTQLGFVAGVTLDSVNREVITVNNDIEDTLMVFSYDAEGNLSPSRLLAVPHQAWGVALNRQREELAVTVESLDAVVFYRREAKGAEAPLRSIIGKSTGLADPHGLYIDEANKEIAVASHGNWSEGDVSVGTLGETAGGKFQPPSITFYADSAQGDAPPLRSIAGPQTKLNWPMGIALDTASGEIVVANNGDDSILFFSRTASGDVAPVRVIRGARTGLDNPMGVAVDPKNKEIYVANFGDHTALVFDGNAKGNATPRRIIRNAPKGTPTVGFGNPMAVAYDTKRGEILVPN